MGLAQWVAGSPAAAIAAWRAGLQRYPLHANLWDRLAGAYHEQGDYEAEQAALVKRLQLADDARARYRLALLLLPTDARSAKASLEAASRLDADVAPAAATLEAALREAGKETDTARRMIVIGRGLGLVEEWALAARVFRLAVQADAGNADARAWLGEARQHINQDGREDLDAAAALAQNSSVVHTLRGLYWRRQGSLGLSLAEYSRATQLEPRNAALRSLLGEAYAANGDLVAALEAYQQAVDLAPEDSTFWRLLAMFCADNEVQVLDVGVAAGLKAVELSPEDPQALDALGWAYSQAGYLVKAEDALQRALARSPSFAGAHVHVGVTYLRWGQNEKALEHWRQALALDPDGPAGRSAAHLLDTYFPK